MGNKSMLTAEQRTQLVLRLLSKEESAAQTARRVGVSVQTLYRWSEEFIGAGKQAINGRGAYNEQAKAVEWLTTIRLNFESVHESTCCFIGIKQKSGRCATGYVPGEPPAA